MTRGFWWTNPYIYGKLRTMKTLLFPLFLFPLFVFAQNSNSKLYLQSGTYTIEKNIDKISYDDFTEREKFLGEIYQIVSFQETPDEQQNCLLYTSPSPRDA